MHMSGAGAKLLAKGIPGGSQAVLEDPPGQRQIRNEVRVPATGAVGRLASGILQIPDGEARVKGVEQGAVMHERTAAPALRVS